MKKLLIVISLFASETSFSQKIIPVFGLEGGALFGGLSEQAGYENSTDFTGSFFIDLIGVNKREKPTVGIKFKFTYSPYNMKYTQSFLNPPPDISIRETTVSALLKFCLASKTNYYNQKGEDDKIHSVKDVRGLFLLAGPQIGFVSITGGESNYAKNNYSIIVGAEYHINRLYLFVCRQIAFTEIYPSKTSVRLNSLSAGIGIPLL